MLELKNMGFFNTYLWKPKIRDEYYGEEFGGFEFENRSRLSQFIGKIGTLKE